MWLYDRNYLFLLGDIHRLREGLETQYYDAFLLYADEDISFANEMIEKLEKEYQLKVLHIYMIKYTIIIWLFLTV